MVSSRDLLLGRIIEHVAQRGLADKSLREIGEAVGSSHRMLLYHFGSRDGLVAAIVEQVEQQQREALRAIAVNATTPSEIMRAQWAQLTDPNLRPFVRLFFEVLSLGLHGRAGTERFVANLTQPWLDVAAEIARDLHTPVDLRDVHLGVAVVRGLLIDVVAGGDAHAATSALERFLDLLETSSAE